MILEFLAVVNSPQLALKHPPRCSLTAFSNLPPHQLDVEENRIRVRDFMGQGKVRENHLPSTVLGETNPT